MGSHVFYFSKEKIFQLQNLAERGLFQKYSFTNRFNDVSFILIETDSFAYKLCGELIYSQEGYCCFWLKREEQDQTFSLTTFNEVLESVPEEIQIKLLYHLDFFR